MSSNFRQEINNISKSLGVRYNVSIRVIDQFTGECVQEHIGHNAATNTLITGIGHYLIGDSVLNQGQYTLSDYVPKYISLGTMGLYNQESDSEGLPSGIGVGLGDEELDFTAYMNQCPGYGADGYSDAENNGRPFRGLGPTFDNRLDKSKTINCELISSSFTRSQISFRDVMKESESELPQTVDVIFSSLISTGGLKQFRESGKDYIYITEAGLWSSPIWSSSSDNGANGLLAAYRIIPSNKSNWDMSDPNNRKILKENILRVGINQVVQVIWKIQLGSIAEFGGTEGSQPIVWQVV